MTRLPNILVLMSDEHSFRCLSHPAVEEFGEPVHTPTLDRLIDRGAFFRTAYCPVPLCTPSRMCMLTGRHAHRCGAWRNRAVLDPSLPTLGSWFSDAGYETYLVGKMHFGGSLQLGGFDHRPYGDMGGPPAHQFDPIHKVEGGTKVGNRVDEAGITTIPEGLWQEQFVVRESLASLREHQFAHADKPWLLVASFAHPHFPLKTPPRHFNRYWPDGVTRPKVGKSGDTVDHPMTVGMRAGFRTDDIGEAETMRARAAYFACVDYLDEILGDFCCCLERSGLLENTIVVYVSDHGEMNGEHGLWWKNCWHEAAVRVPFVIQTPGQREGTAGSHVWDETVNLVDLFPTLCGLTGIRAPEGLDGLDLSASVDGRRAPSRQPRVVSHFLYPRWGEGMEFRIVRSGSLKYISFYQAPELLFDLEKDPLEQDNLSGAADVVEELRSLSSSDFDWGEVCRLRDTEGERLRVQYANRVEMTCPNQYILPDGRVVEADSILYSPQVLADAPGDIFDDWPQKDRG